MATPIDPNQVYSTCGEQVRYVLVPVPIQYLARPDPMPLPTDVGNFYASPLAPALWDQTTNATFFPPLVPNDVALDVAETNIALALSVQASLQQGSLDAGPPASYPFEYYDTDTTINLENLMPGIYPAPLDGTFNRTVQAPCTVSGQPFPCSLESPAMASDASCSTSPPSTPEIYFCSEPTCIHACTFTRLTDLKRHERRKHRHNFRCELCAKAHADRRALNRHLMSQHPDYAAQIGVRSERTRCKKCDYISRSDNVRRHERTQHGLSGDD